MCTESVKSTLFRSTVLHCTPVSYSGTIKLNPYVNCVQHNIFRLLRNEPRNCSASHMFVSRGLPTCKMLIRKEMYGLMTSLSKS